MIDVSTLSENGVPLSEPLMFVRPGRPVYFGLVRISPKYSDTLRTHPICCVITASYHFQSLTKPIGFWSTQADVRVAIFLSRSFEYLLAIF